MMESSKDVVAPWIRPMRVVEMLAYVVGLARRSKGVLLSVLLARRKCNEGLQAVCE